jgi:hypothetical protein
MARKMKPVVVPGLRKQIRGAIKELDDIEKDLEKVQATLERFLNRPQATGEDEYYADLRALIRKRR